MFEPTQSPILRRCMKGIRRKLNFDSPMHVKAGTGPLPDVLKGDPKDSDTDVAAK